MDNIRFSKNAQSFVKRVLQPIYHVLHNNFFEEYQIGLCDNRDDLLRVIFHAARLL